jgi:hypothetical protein
LASAGAHAGEDKYAGLSQSAAASFCGKLGGGEQSNCEKALLSGAGDAAAEAAAWSFPADRKITAAVDGSTRFKAVVYRAWRNDAGELRIALTNGDVWSQRGGKKHPLPQPGDEVSFKPDLTRKYVLNFADKRDAIKVAPLSVAQE